MTQYSAEFAPQLAWVKRQLTKTNKALSNIHPSSAKIAICTHLDIKMVPVYESLLEAGHQLFITTCDPNTVRNDVVTYLVEKGAKADAWLGMTESEWRQSLQNAIDWKPDFICEFGGELTSLYQSQKASGLKAALEGTGSGIARLESLTLDFPVFNWDDLDAKEGLHNRHMVGLTAWQAFCQRTHLTLHEKNITVIGYGLVGQGVAAAAKAYGGHVSIAERDPARKLMAAYDGWATGELDTLLATTDVLVTATGIKGIVGLRELEALPDNAFVLNVGHGTGEINTQELAERPNKEILPFIHEYQLNNRSIFLLANGAMFNLTAGFGDSINAFDVTLAIMASGINFMMKNTGDLTNGIHLLPDEAWKPSLSQ